MGLPRPRISGTGAQPAVVADTVFRMGPSKSSSPGVRSETTSEPIAGRASPPTTGPNATSNSSAAAGPADCAVASTNPGTASLSPEAARVPGPTGSAPLGSEAASKAEGGPQ